MKIEIKTARADTRKPTPTFEARYTNGQVDVAIGHIASFFLKDEEWATMAAHWAKGSCRSNTAVVMIAEWVSFRQKELRRWDETAAFNQGMRAARGECPQLPAGKVVEMWTRNRDVLADVAAQVFGVKLDSRGGRELARRVIGERGDALFTSLVLLHELVDEETWGQVASALRLHRQVVRAVTRAIRRPAPAEAPETAVEEATPAEAAGTEG